MIPNSYSFYNFHPAVNCSIMPTLWAQFLDIMAEDQNGGNAKRTVAILIDGDNAQAIFIKEILAEATKYGRITIGESMAIGHLQT